MGFGSKAASPAEPAGSLRQCVPFLLATPRTLTRADAVPFLAPVGRRRARRAASLACEARARPALARAVVDDGPPALQTRAHAPVLASPPSLPAPFFRLLQLGLFLSFAPVRSRSRNARAVHELDLPKFDLLKPPRLVAARDPGRYCKAASRRPRGSTTFLRCPDAELAQAREGEEERAPARSDRLLRCAPSPRPPYALGAAPVLCARPSTHVRSSSEKPVHLLRRRPSRARSLPCPHRLGRNHARSCPRARLARSRRGPQRLGPRPRAPQHGRAGQLQRVGRQDFGSFGSPAAALAGRGPTSGPRAPPIRRRARVEQEGGPAQGASPGLLLTFTVSHAH